MKKFSILLCISFLFYFHPITSRKITNNPFHVSPSLSPSHMAERLIKSFNLKPKHDANIIPEDGAEAPRLVERQFNLPVALGGVSAGNTSISDLGHHAGYFKLSRPANGRMFYFFFESRSNKTDPVVIWLTGGPGCSGEIALFTENGPFKVTEDLSLTLNDFGWDKVSNLIYVDQPVGTGFSYTSNSSDIPEDSQGASDDLYEFLQAFFKEHPELAKNDFFITGESYAGHYIPALASRVQRGNKDKEGIHINLKGLAIGNGLTNPEVQYGAYSDYALEMKLISKSFHDSIDQAYPRCQKAIIECNENSVNGCSQANSLCNSIFEGILSSAPGINYYDIRKQCEGNLCYDFSNVETFLNQVDVKKALGVGDIDYVSCSTRVQSAMSSDLMKNFEVGIPNVLEDGIKLLIYAGEYDLICNWLGNSKWVHQMKWSGQKDFGSVEMVPFTVNGKDAGLMKNHGPLTFLKVYDAGHLVPMDQPEASLQMLQEWMQGKLSSPEK